MNDNKELIIINNINVVDIFKENGIDSILQSIKDQVSTEVPDVSTLKGRNRIASLSHKVARSKTILDKLGKDLADDLNAKLKPINNERKKAREFLDNLKDEVRRPLTQWEEKEEERIRSIKERVYSISDYHIFEPGHIIDEHSLTSKECQEEIEMLEKMVIDDSFEEFELLAHHEKEKTIIKFKEYLPKIIKYEEEQEKIRREREELEKLRAAQQEEQRKKQEEELRIKIEKQERERLDNERIESARKIQEAKEREEQAKKELEELKVKKLEDERIAAEKAKNDEINRQIAKQRKEEEERLKKEADSLHVKNVLSYIKEKFIEFGCKEDAAIKLIKAIKNKEIQNIHISF